TYNTKEKDNKSFNYVVITNEDFPRVVTMRSRGIETKLNEIKYSFGPFPQGSVLREALNIVRKIFPFRDKCKVNIGRPCFNAQIGLCPGVCSGSMTKTEYAKTIQRIKLFFEGKKKALIGRLEREMKTAARNQNFEEAGKIKKAIFALNHIQDVALLKADFLRASAVSQYESLPVRIEAYDVAHISGTHTVGVMVVLEDNEPKKSEYRKFKIKTSTNDDNASLREMLIRRLSHPEWQMPKLIVVDGGIAQVNTAEKVLSERGIDIPVVGVVKDEHHKPKDFLVGKNSILKPALGIFDRAIVLANSEAHRFAVGYHRTLRGKMK
ncbi:MAG: UvrB/UvrC motif-containing protein, partial [Minisyncoccia bacterium]